MNRRGFIAMMAAAAAAVRIGLEAAGVAVPIGKPNDPYMNAEFHTRYIAILGHATAPVHPEHGFTVIRTNQ